MSTGVPGGMPPVDSCRWWKPIRGARCPSSLVSAKGPWAAEMLKPPAKRPGIPIKLIKYDKDDSAAVDPAQLQELVLSANSQVEKRIVHCPMKSDDRRIDSLRLLHPLEISFGVMFGRRQLHQQKFKSELRASANDTGTYGRVDTPSLSLCKHAVLAVVNLFSFSTPLNQYGSRLRK